MILCSYVQGTVKSTRIVAEAEVAAVAETTRRRTESGVDRKTANAVVTESAVEHDHVIDDVVDRDRETADVRVLVPVTDADIHGASVRDRSQDKSKRAKVAVKK
jgi:hypothetical protein